jgi:outer membrane lipoprotein SlyB
MRNIAAYIMKMKLTYLALSGFGVFSLSCTNGPNARSGTAVGAVGGAAAGGIIGHQSGRTMEGALIGGGLGALGGNVIGGNQDQNRR